LKRTCASPRNRTTANASISGPRRQGLAERERIGRLIKQISADIPLLLVEHDIDRLFQLADAVTVMNGGQS
jgi:ABC-type molybdate transport system ATPase subunit